MCADSSPSEVTALLTQLSQGDKSVIERLMPLVYDELHLRASRYMRQERAGHTLQPTALVHEAYLKLVGQREASFRNRAHFFAIASQLMRRILIDHARARLTVRRGGDQAGLSLQYAALEYAAQLRTDTPQGMIAVDDALQKLKALDPRQEQIVEMRFFGGLTVEETAEVLGVSTRTIEREWTVARAWLYAQLKEHAIEG
ncbi:MAG: sigma-70 family RNA polymerase sigma factor [Terracidiphilus sp.]